jgi:hypothetical protein
VNVMCGKRHMNQFSIAVVSLSFICFSALTWADANKYEEEHFILGSGAAQVEAISTSTLVDRANSGRYSVRNLFDNDKSTAWVTRYNKESPYAERGLLRIKFKTPVYAKSILIRNGYQKSEKLYFENQRAKVLNIEKVVDGNQRLPYEYTVGLDDKLGEQNISLQDGWVQAINLLKTKEVIINVLEIYEGSKYDDLCISDLAINYSDETEYLPSITWEKLDRMIKDNAIKRNRNWDWDGLTKNDYKLLNDLVYYALSGNKEAYKLFNTYSPRESSLSAETLKILKKGVQESQPTIK